MLQNFPVACPRSPEINPAVRVVDGVVIHAGVGRVACDQGAVVADRVEVQVDIEPRVDELLHHL